VRGVALSGTVPDCPDLSKVTVIITGNFGSHDNHHGYSLRSAGSMTTGRERVRPHNCSP
jgi:hypothetical protein